jgi:hypothetical protein
MDQTPNLEAVFPKQLAFIFLFPVLTTVLTNPHTKEGSQKRGIKW